MSVRRIELALLIGLLGIGAPPARALTTGPFFRHIEYTGSVASWYDARSVFLNPAALGYQTELNGASPLSSFSAALNQGGDNEYSFGLSYGALGFGYERILTGTGAFNRYGFSLGFALSPYLYYGTRYTFTGSSTPSLDGYDSLDLGLQLRPSPHWALGFLAETVNQPRQGGVVMPTRYVLGAEIRPIPPIALTVDVDTLSNDFAKSFGYDANVAFEILRGLKVRGGYHHQHEWQIGIQFNLALSSYYSVVRPRSGNQSVLIGAQMGLKPYPSFIPFHSGLEVEVDGRIGEEPVYGGLFGEDRPALLHVLENIDDASVQPDIDVIALKIKSFPLGLAAAQDLHTAILLARQKGKRVVAFLGNAGLKEYLIASAADAIYIEPGAELRLTGLAESRYYLKGTLDKLGVEGELLAKGKYKSAPETFTRKGASPAAREASRERLKNAEAAVLEILKTGMRIDEAKWKGVLDHALFSPEEAKEWGLVDAVGSFNAERDSLGAFFTKRVDYQHDVIALPARVAVIVASGDILQSRSQLLSFAGQSQITYSRMEKRFERALSDPLTKAIVLRVSSPGGEILPSRQIADLVSRARKEKPVVVSMGDYAASGGYMISAPANRVFALPTTQTGSIGVFLGKVNLSGLYKKIDLHKEIETTAPFADLYSEDRGLSSGGREILSRRLDDYYDNFVRFVATQRGLAFDAVEKVAQGRVWMGTQAAAHKLVDQTGGYLAAIRHAAELGGISGDHYEYPVVHSPPSLFSPFGDGGWLKASASESPFPSLSKEIFRQVHWAQVLTDNPMLYFSPTGKLE